MKPDIQICNHNYLLADAAHRQQDRPLLLRSYQALVVDEAHKLPDAARQMYTESLSEREMQELCTLLRQAHYSHIAQNLRTAFRTLVLACQHSRTWKEKNRLQSFWAYSVSQQGIGRLYCTATICRLPGRYASVLAEPAGRGGKHTASFSLGGSHTHSLHRNRYARSADMLCGQQSCATAFAQCALEHRRTGYFNLRHAGRSGKL